MGSPAGQQPPGVAAPPPSPDMVSLYQKMMKESEARKQIDSGITLVAAGFAQPENRNALIQAATGSGSGGGQSPSAALETMMKLQTAQEARTQRAALMARIPQIAKEMGVSIDQAMYMASTGKLDEVMAAKHNPSAVEVVKGADGSNNAFNKATGQMHQITGADTKLDTQVVQNPDGSSFLVDKQTGNNVATLGGPNGTQTSDTKEWLIHKEEAAKAGKPHLSLQEWLTSVGNARAPKTNINTGDNELAKGFAKSYIDDYDTARSSKVVIDKVATARDQLEREVIAGSVISPLELQGRKVLASILGIPDEKTTNTETFISSMKEIVLPKVKALGSGSGISNADVKFIEEAVGATNTLNADSIRRLLTISEKAERAKILDYNGNIDKLAAKNPSAGEVYRRVDVPPPSKYLLATIPPEATEKLRQNNTPENRAEFNRKFGHGIAEHLVGGQ